jgi:outer membrane protein assembly factor BamA
VYRAGTISFAGEKVGTDEEMTRQLKTRPGDVVSRSVVRADIQALQKFAHAKGIDIDFAPELALSPQQGVANLVLRGTRR